MISMVGKILFRFLIRIWELLQLRLDVSWILAKLGDGEVNWRYCKDDFPLNENFETNIQIYHKYTLFKSLKAQKLYEKCQAELSEYEELPNIMEYGKRPFQIWYTAI